MPETIRINDSVEYSHLNEFRAEGKFPDVVLKVQDKSFPCHRIVLISAMEYFRKRFSFEIPETNEEVLVKWPNANDFDLVLTYAYGGSVSIGPDNIYRLWKISNFLGFQKLEDSCIDYIVRDETSISPDSAINIFMYANRVGKVFVVDRLIGWMAKNFLRLVKNEKFFYISANDLMKIFTSPSFVRNPTKQLDFLMTWVKYQSEEGRNQFLSQLMDTIELTNIPKDWFMQAVLSNAVAENGEDEVSSAERATQLALFNMEFDEIDLFITENKKKINLPFGIFILDDETHTLEKFRLETEDDFNSVPGSRISLIESGPTHTFENFGCSCVPLDKAQFVILSSSAQVDMRTSQHSWKLYVENNLNEMKFVYQGYGETFWEPLAENRDWNFITTTTYNTDIVFYNNVDFIIYKCDRNDSFNMDTNNFQRTLCPNLLSHDNNSIYMIGGKYSPSVYRQNGYADLAISEKDGKLLQHYDIRQKDWMQLPQMKYARCRAASCVHNDNLYVSGGDYLTYNRNFNIEYFDIRAGRWNELETPMPKPKKEHSLVVFNNRLWFFGGVESDSVVCYDEVNPDDEEPVGDAVVSYDSTWFSYDLEACGSWSNVFSLPTPKRILGVVVEI